MTSFIFYSEVETGLRSLYIVFSSNLNTNQHQQPIIRGTGQAVTLDSQAREHRLFN